MSDRESGKAGRFLGKTRTIHPFLFAVYPPIFILSRNFDALTTMGLVVILGIFVAVVAAVWIGCGYCLRWDMRGSAILASVSSLILLAYVQIYIAANGVSIAGLQIGRHRFLLSVAALLLLSLMYLVSRIKAYVGVVTRLMNLAGLSLVVLASMTVFGETIGTAGIPPGAGCLANVVLSGTARLSGSPEVQTTPAGRAKLPDIYYIILDGYGRSDVLRDYYGHDNSRFLGELRGRGFYIAEESNANYCQTTLSLASSLNGCYLDPRQFRIWSGDSCRASLAGMIRNSAVVGVLRMAGYEFISFSSGYGATEIPRADVYMAPSVLPIFSELAFISALPIGGLFYALDSHFVFRIQYERLLYTFENLGTVAGQSTPRFIFSHIMAPHPPFVFGERGEFRSYVTTDPLGDGKDFHRMNPDLQKDYAERYKDQITFVETKIVEVVDEILERSPTAVMILQGDHGPSMLLDSDNPQDRGLRERMGILNAYRFPPTSRRLLYSKISPVNSFRLLLNDLLHLDLEILGDRSYFSTYGNPLNLKDVTPIVADDSK